MFNELEDLLKLTKCFEAVATTDDEPEEDLDADYVDFGDSSTDAHAQADIIKVKGVAKKSASEQDGEDYEKSNNGKCTCGKEDCPECGNSDIEHDIHAETNGTKHLGGSANVIKDGTKAGPIFEEDTITDPPIDEDMEIEEEGVFGGLKNNFTLSECVTDGLGKQFAYKYQLECCGQKCGNGFNLGDVVHCPGAPVLFIVKKNDGSALTLAKPTRNENEFCNSREGRWPEFTYDADTVKPMLNVSIDDITKILDFNDRDISKDTGFNGRSYDETPMKVAQKAAIDNSFDRIADRLDDILGMSYHDACTGKNKDFCYTGVSPKVVIQNPDGSITTKQNIGGYQIKIGD